MAATAAAAALSSALTHKSIATSLRDLPSPRVNVVHLQRSLDSLQQPAASTLLSTPRGVQAVVEVEQPDAATAYLLSAVTCPRLQQQLHQDLAQTISAISAVLQLQHVHAKLQIVTQQSCPRWHADSVGVRMLCTYDGPGTWYIANRHVRRRFNPFTGDTSVAGVADDRHAIQTAPGDLLFLKGNAFPGLHGAGAVHKSPELQDGEARLLLTVDDACC